MPWRQRRRYIGRSYGGAVAIDLALRYPERVRALVLLEGDALGLSPGGLQWTRAIRDRLREVAARDGSVLVRRLVPRPPLSDLFGVKGRSWLRQLELPVEEQETIRGVHAPRRVPRR